MGSAKFTETMIGSKDLEKTSQFYRAFLGMELSNPGDGKSFVILKDPKTGQSLCIVADPSIKNALPSIESEDIDTTVAELEALGGKVVSRETYTAMTVANVEDFEGRKMCVWQSQKT